VSIYFIIYVNLSTSQQHRPTVGSTGVLFMCVSVTLYHTIVTRVMVNGDLYFTSFSYLSDTV